MTMKFAFAGKMRSGKDVSADYLESRLISMGYTVTRLAFAETLKRIAEFAQKEAGVPVVKDRELLQFIGVHFRGVNPEVWVDVVRRKIEEAIYDWYTDVVLITDLRFPNEFEMLREEGFTLVRTHASEPIRVMRGAEVNTLTHISETALDGYTPNDWNHFIVNEGTFQELHEKLNLVIAKAQLMGSED